MDGPFAASLERQRERLNAQFALARRLNRRLDPDAFTKHLLFAVEPTIVAVADLVDSDETIDRVLAALYDVSLELVGRELAGPSARHPWITRLWMAGFPRLAKFFLDDPRDLAAALSNAIHNMAAEGDSHAQRWLDDLVIFGGSGEQPTELMDIGTVVAWRRGLAHLRARALESWRRLPDDLRRTLLALPGDADLGEVDRRMADPFRLPSAPVATQPTLRLVGSVGGFRGFGGAFICPPDLIEVDGQLYAIDNSGCFSIHADCFGATVKRFGGSLPEGRSTGGAFKLQADGIVTHVGGTTQVRALRGSSSHASNGSMLAVAKNHSHDISIVALVSGGS